MEECTVTDKEQGIQHRPDTRRKEKKERTRDQMIMDLENRQLEEMILIRQSIQSMEQALKSMGHAMQSMDTSMKELVQLQKVNIGNEVEEHVHQVFGL